MKILSVHGVEFAGVVYPGVYSKLDKLTYEFRFGRVYLLDGPVEGGGWAFVHTLAGLASQMSGQFFLNDTVFPEKRRSKEVWYVRRNEIKRFGVFGHQSTYWQIKHGIRTHKQLRTLQDFVMDFDLSDYRLKRPFRHLSNEAWRASCAIGLANGKQIFCFPHMQFMRPDFDEESYLEFFKKILSILKSENTLIFLPINVTERNAYIGDEIIKLP